jgi:predicted transcriptional regulator
MVTFVKRGRLDIIYRILSTCRTPSKQTHVMYNANLSYSQLKKFFAILLETDLLKAEVTLYRTTVKGFEFMEKYEEIQRLLS